MAQQRVIPSGANHGKTSATVTKNPRKTATVVKTGNATMQFFNMIANEMAKLMKQQANQYRRGWSRFNRHQGEKEKARRVRQMARGIIHA
jgi:formylmethanofuran dehydrogenase subunit E